MRCASIVAMVLLLPFSAAGQTQGPAPIEPGDTRVAGSGGPALGPLATASAAAAQELRTPAPPPPDPPKRRPSMVGYINDASIQSQLRIRFDTAGDLDSPDRAEFFYPKCGCYRDLPTTHPAYDPEAPGPGPGIATEVNAQNLYAMAEYAVSDRFSVFGELPIRWLQPQAFAPGSGAFDNSSGISDLRAGVKLGLLASDMSAVTLQLQATFPTGDGRKGLGVEHFSFEPALLFNGAPNDRLRIEGQFAMVFPSGGSDGIATTSETFAGKVLYYGIGPSFEVYRSDAVRFAPVLELVGWHVVDGFETATFSEVEGLNIVNLKVGGRFVFRERSSVYAGYGRALTDTWWYRDVFRLEYRYGF